MDKIKEQLTVSELNTFNNSYDKLLAMARCLLEIEQIKGTFPSGNYKIAGIFYNELDNDTVKFILYKPKIKMPTTITFKYKDLCLSDEELSIKLADAKLQRKFSRINRE